MKPFRFSFAVKQPVDDGISHVFAEMCRSLQGSFETLAAEHCKDKDRIAALERENQARISASRRAGGDACGDAAGSAGLHVTSRAAQDAAPQIGPQPPGPQRLPQPAAVGPAPPVHPVPPPPSGEEVGAGCARGGGGARAGGGRFGGFTLERAIKIHNAPVHSVAMSPEGQMVATASWDSTCKLYNFGSDEVVRTFGSSGGDASAEPSAMGGLYAAAFAKTAPDILGCTSCDHSVYLWNTLQGTCTKLSGHNDEVNGIDFHPIQHVMCTTSDDCKALIWDFQGGAVLRTLEYHTRQVYGTTFLGAENQYLVATSCFDQKTRIFDMREKQVVAQLHMHSDEVVGIDYSSNLRYLATGSDDGLIKVSDSRHWRLQQTIDTRKVVPDNEVKRVAFSADGGFLAAACSSGRVLVYDMKDASLHASLDGHSDCVFDVTWGTCPRTGARILISASHDHTCHYWREALQ